MENIFKGWDYINALFLLMKEITPSGLIAPKYIYRGITKRHFTSSTVLDSYLKNHPKEEKEIEEKWLSGLNKLKNPMDKQEFYYKELYEKFCEEYKNEEKDNKTLEKLRRIVQNPLFSCIKPEYILFR